MSGIFTYKGKIKANFPASRLPYGKWEEYNTTAIFTGSPIVWDEPVPILLSGLTVPDLQSLQRENRFVLGVLYGINVSFNGDQKVGGDFCFLENGELILYAENGTIVIYNRHFDKNDKSYVSTKNYPCTYNYHVNFTEETSTYPTVIKVHASNIGVGSGEDVTGVTYVVTFLVTVSINCTGGNINSMICTDLCVRRCLTIEGCETCLGAFLDYCFPSGLPPEQWPIITSDNCYSYFDNFSSHVGPISEIDSKLSTYCSQFRGFADLFNCGAEPVPTASCAKNITLCACHMPSGQYDNFRNELDKLAPGFNNVPGINKYCIVPACASTAFTNTSIGKTCPLPACLNIVFFSNNGTFNNSDVTIINQSGECSTAVAGSVFAEGGGPSPSPSPSPSPQPETKNFLYIFIIGGVVVFLIVLAVFWYFSRSKK